MRLLLFLGTLQTGGAERQFASLATGLARRGHEVALVTIWPGGQFWDQVSSTNEFELKSLSSRPSRSRSDTFSGLAAAAARLRRIIRSHGSDAVYSALEFSNAIAWLATRGSRASLVWGERASDMVLNRVLIWPFRFCTMVSPTVSLAIANSDAGRGYLTSRYPYRPRRFEVVPNGIDVNHFRFDSDGRRRVRAEWGIQETERLVGLVGRDDPMKDRPAFIEAARRVAAERPGARFVCVGAPTPAPGANHPVHWAGPRSDLPAVYSALDVFVLSSAYGEGFPNVVGEAMACERPCVVTDVGDSRTIVGDTGLVVPPRDPIALAAAIRRALDSPPADASAIRRRIVESFSVDHMIARTEELLADVVERRTSYPR